VSLPGSWRRYGTPSTSTSSPKLSAIACKSSRNTSRTASPLMVNASTSRSPKLPPDSTARSVRRTFAIAFFTSGLASSFVRSTIAMGVLRRRLVLQPLRRGNLLINSPGYASFHRSDIDPGPLRGILVDLGLSDDVAESCEDLLRLPTYAQYRGGPITVMPSRHA